MKRQRHGFTLVELLVVITIISILMGLLIPAVNAAREAARKSECGVKMKNLALAAVQHENSKGYLPGFCDKFGFFPGGVDRSDLGNFSGSVPPHVKVAGYGVPILPWLEAQSTYEQWTDDSYPVISDGMGELDASIAVGASGAGAGFHAYAAPNLEIFQCPSNPVTDATSGRNSYVINAGMSFLRTTACATATSSTAGFTATQIGCQAKNNGVGKARYMGTNVIPGVGVGPSVTLDDLKDGQGYTAIYSENVQALPWFLPGFLNGHTATPNLTQVDTTTPSPQDLDFQLVNTGGGPGAFCGSQFSAGMVWHYEDPQAMALNAASPTYDSPGGLDVGLPTFKIHEINGGGVNVSQDIFTLQMTLGNCADLARPSSAHVDSVNMAFADGSNRSVASSINYRVYQAILTPRGKSSDVPWAEFVITDELGAE